MTASRRLIEQTSVPSRSPENYPFDCWWVAAVGGVDFSEPGSGMDKGPHHRFRICHAKTPISMTRMHY